MTEHQWTAGLGVCDFLPHRLLAAVLLLCAFTANADELTVRGDVGHYTLNDRITYLPDGDQTIDQVTQQEQWQEKHDDSVLNLGFTDQAVWLRTSLRIPTSLTQQWYLVIPYPLLEEVDLFLLRDGQQPAFYHINRQQAERQREQAHSYQIALPLPQALSGRVDVFLRAQSATSLQVPVALWREDHLLNRFSRESLYWGVYFGALCALVIYNLFLFLSIRDSAYGYYVLYIVSISLLMLCISGVGSAWLWSGQPLLTRYALPVSTGLVSLCAVMFARSFLRWREISARWDRSMKIAATLAGILVVYTWIDPIHGALFAGLLGFLVVVLLIAVGIAGLRAGIAIARYFVLAWAAFALGASLYLLSVFNVLPVNILTNHAMQVGSAAEVLLLSFALAHRIKDERARKLAALRRQQRAERQVQDLELQSLEQAMHDSTTGMPNASLLNQQLQAVIGQDKRAALVLVNYPQVKEIASSMGYNLAESMFRELVKKLNHRLEGQTGAICLENKQPAFIAIPEFSSAAFLIELDHLTDTLEPFVEQVVGHHEVSVHTVRLPVLMNLHSGVAITPEHGDSPEILYQHALAARDRSESSKVPVQVYNKAISDFARRRLDLMTALPPAIEAGELELYLQPQMNRTGQTLVGVEMLLRWHSGQFGTVPTWEVIEIAESAGLIDLLSRYVVAQACKTMQTLRERDLEITGSINLSVQNLTNHHFVPEAMARIREHDIPTNSMIFEVTETSMMHNMESVIGSLQLIADSGCRIALDDFGTGYSSLAYLSRLPIHELKIDRCFISKMCTNRNDLGIVKNTLKLARTLNLEAVAEGVEDNATMERLTELGCHRLQGYVFAKPMPLETFCDWALEHSLS
ncbi:EAL domain-containing protein (putative c-di-GMP-specific phosphodiesterase class I) [Tamilnaduibacter salinus]|uniref:EAL domain-containing protein (Putative c-di-GMP-specific phosphodiesterase class I) n=1 Tax=Tamilnaduibacter salinus TaxID=1484056 RepID=A0A2U1CTI0_9GAMM|nr:EAL domain-containing protein [Tamilnaduibacter salinus]PVY70046.1 EAL domain-containing protein (putative c-di-GMP-specific phosphodiesterase class I) [Tamilnaduibacter salinus]